MEFSGVRKANLTVCGFLFKKKRRVVLVYGRSIVAEDEAIFLFASA